MWFWDDDGLDVYVLTDGDYTQTRTSRIFPGLDIAELERFIRMDDQVDAVWQFRALLTARHASLGAALL